MTRKKIGIMLSTPPESPGITTVAGLSSAALAKGHEVYLYLIDEGTRNLSDARLAKLKTEGLKLFVCAYGAERQGIYPSDEAVFCGLVVLSDIVKGCDRFIAFN